MLPRAVLGTGWQAQLGSGLVRHCGSSRAPPRPPPLQRVASLPGTRSSRGLQGRACSSSGCAPARPAPPELCVRACLLACLPPPPPSASTRAASPRAPVPAAEMGSLAGGVHATRALHRSMYAARHHLWLALGRLQIPLPRLSGACMPCSPVPKAPSQHRTVALLPTDLLVGRRLPGLA